MLLGLFDLFQPLRVVQRSKTHPLSIDLLSTATEEFFCAFVGEFSVVLFRVEYRSHLIQLHLTQHAISRYCDGSFCFGAASLASGLDVWASATTETGLCYVADAETEGSAFHSRGSQSFPDAAHSL